MINENKFVFFVLVTSFFLFGCFSEELAKGKRTQIVTAELKLKTTDEIKLPKQSKSLSWGGADHNKRFNSNFLLSRAPKEVWRISSGLNSIVGMPLIFKHKLYAVDKNGNLKCFDLKTKEENWNISLIPPGEKGANLVGGGLAIDSTATLYATTSFGEVVSISTVSEDVLWRYKFNSPFLASPTVLKNGIIVINASGDARFFSSQGKLNWFLDGSDSKHIRSITGRPISVNDMLLLPTSGGSLNAVDQKTGFELWSFNFDSQRKGYARSVFGTFDGDPIVSNGKIFYGSANGQFVSLGFDGEKKWQSPIGLKGSPLAISNSLFFISDLNKLTRVDKNDGSVIWSNSVSDFKETQQFFSPLLAGSKLWVTGSNQYLLSFDPETGVLLDKIFLGGVSSGPPIYYSESIIVYTKAGKFVAFR